MFECEVVARVGRLSPQDWEVPERVPTRIEVPETDGYVVSQSDGLIEWVVACSGPCL